MPCGNKGRDRSDATEAKELHGLKTMTQNQEEAGKDSEEAQRELPAAQALGMIPGN